MLKKVMAVIAGLLLAVILIMIAQSISTAIYPMPDGLDLEDKKAFAAWVKTLPITALLIVLLSYIIGSFAGGYIAAFISKSSVVPSLIVGSLLMTAGFYNLYTIPHAVWFAIVSSLLYIPCAYLGAKLVLK